MTGAGKEGFPEARPAHGHYTELWGRPWVPGKQGRRDIKYVINREPGQVNTVRTGNLHSPHVCPGPGPRPCSQRCCWPLRCCCPLLPLRAARVPTGMPSSLKSQGPPPRHKSLEVHGCFVLFLFFWSLAWTTLSVVRKLPRKRMRKVRANTNTWSTRSIASRHGRCRRGRRSQFIGGGGTCH